jgi:hypothetical protein
MVYSQDYDLVVQLVVMKVDLTADMLAAGWDVLRVEMKVFWTAGESALRKAFWLGVNSAKMMAAL